MLIAEQTINDRLKEIRKFFHLSQIEMGKKLNISNSAVSKIEKGENDLRDTHIKALIWELGINENWLRTGKGEMLVDDSVTSYDHFEQFLKSLGYNLQGYTSNDGEKTILEISKDGKSKTFKDNEFEAFQDEIRNYIAYLFWKQNN